jgi:hypothetical protein
MGQPWMQRLFDGALVSWRVTESAAQSVALGALFVSPGAHRAREARLATHRLPAPPRSVATAVHATVDELFLSGFRLVEEDLTAADAERIAVEAAEAVAVYRRAGWLDDPASYHAAPDTPVEVDTHPVSIGRNHAEVAAWDSGWRVAVGEPGSERWDHYLANRRARTVIFRHPGPPRPWLVCVHPARSGRAGPNLTMFRAAHLYRDLGLNLAFPLLPLHGPRARGCSATFPTMDIMDNVHGLAQAAWDVRRTLAWLRAEGASSIGLTGISLGGYVSALVAGLEPALACVIVGSPAADFPALFARHGAGTQPHLVPLLSLCADAHTVVSPLRLAPRTPRDRLFVHAGLADRLGPPIDHAVPIWEHWGRPSACWHPGGHLGFVVRPEVGRFVDEALTSSGLVSPGAVYEVIDEAVDEPVAHPA